MVSARIFGGTGDGCTELSPYHTVVADTKFVVKKGNIGTPEPIDIDER
jgi:hypothetical protein